ncbi:hypothetical protein LI224_18525, partial [Erysipelatoclostridium ramosum]|uniref:hypothetical protein n=1 Tax=Thomasclavelia ramosa TaxID=1547 RepID=UPI001D07A822
RHRKWQMPRIPKAPRAKQKRNKMQQPKGNLRLFLGRTQRLSRALHPLVSCGLYMRAVSCVKRRMAFLDSW